VLIGLNFVYLPVVNRCFLNRRQLSVAAITQTAEIASISDYFHRPCLFLVTIILLKAGFSWWEAWDQLTFGLTKTMINNA